MTTQARKRSDAMARLTEAKASPDCLANYRDVLKEYQAPYQGWEMNGWETFTVTKSLGPHSLFAPDSALVAED